MWTRKQLKAGARQSVSHNYWRTVAVCLLATILISGISLGSLHTGLTSDAVDGTLPEIDLSPGGWFDLKSNSDIVNEFLNGTTGGAAGDLDPAWRPTRGVLAVFFNNITQSKSFAFGVLNSLNQFLFQDRVSAGIIILIGALLSLFYWFFVRNVLEVGQCRFFLETRRYYQTDSGRMLFPYRVRRTRKTAWTMFFRAMYQIFWSFTIVGGIVKFYSYRMIPYILAENPDVSRKEAFALSRAMMKGQKWRAFRLHLSFLGWALLNLLTLGLLGVFYLSPYQNATWAELYMELRREARERGLPGIERLNDRYLDAEPGDTAYPVEQYPLQEPAGRRWMHSDYRQSYSLTSLILLFFSFSCVGWLWEVMLHLFADGVFVNRGVLFGPWLPIYGSGGVLVLILLKPVRDKPLLTFGLTVLICGVIEYATSWFLETTQHMKWWDYTGYFLNLNGRVCLEGLVIFGLGGCAGIYILAPLLNQWFRKIPRKTAVILCVVLLLLFSADVVYSQFHPNTGKGISTGVSAPAENPPSS